MLDVALSTDFMETPIYSSFFDFCLAGSAYAYLDENLANFLLHNQIDNFILLQ